MPNNSKVGTKFVQKIRKDLKMSGGSAFSREIDLIAEGVLKIVKAETRRQFSKSPNSKGGLEKSWKTKTRRTRRKQSIAVITKKPYAIIQDKGGTITPTRARNLAIPLTAQARNRSPRHFGKELFFVRIRNKSFLAIKTGGGRIRPQYVLKRVVRIPATNYLKRATNRSKTFVNKKMIAAMKRITLKASRKAMR